MRIEQVLPGFNRGDAMSNEARLLQRHFRGLGIDTAIYAEHIQPQAREECIPVAQFFLRPPPDLTIYHYGVGTPITQQLRRWPGPKLMIYHNVTPPQYFRNVNDEMVRLCQQGRSDLFADRRRYQAVWACSDFSRRELACLGFERVRHVPIPLDWEEYNQEPDRNTLRRLDALAGPHILFVGRMSVNKRQDDIVRAFAIFRALYERDAHLWLVGTAVGQERYLAQVEALAERFGVANQVHFIGHAAFPALLAYYQGCHLFLSMSEHEGLGIPWLEAQYFGLPVVAYAAAAIPETVGSGGLLFGEKDFEQVAALMALVLRREDIRLMLRDEGRKQAQTFSPRRILPDMDRYLTEDFPKLSWPEVPGTVGIL